MNINRTNYEAFLLDLVEGRLTPEEQRAVRNFLLQNPDLNQEMETGTAWTLDRSEVSFSGKEGLKKEFPDAESRLNSANFDLFSIARLEGDLTREQLQDHDSMLARDNKLNREWMEWQKTRLPAQSIVFKEKESLKKNKGIRPRTLWIAVISSAAAIALAIVVFRMDSGIPESEIALSEQVTSSLPDDNKPSAEQPDSPSAPGKESDLLAHSPVTLSIRKHQDPPELTGEEKDSPVGTEEADTTQQIREQQIKPRTVQVAILSRQVIKTPDHGNYDRISPIDIPPSSIHLTSLSIAQLAELDLQEILEDYREENALSIWSIANAGIKGINRITGAEMSLLASRDEEGDVSGVQFKSRRFSVATPLDRSE